MNKKILLGIAYMVLTAVVIVLFSQVKTSASAETSSAANQPLKGSAGQVFKSLSTANYNVKIQALTIKISNKDNAELAGSESANQLKEVSGNENSTLGFSGEQVNTQVTATSVSYTLTNGNTAGEIGTAAAAQMAAATGVSQDTWEYIIARESNGDYTASNGSGASGLFQTMPGWGSTATVEDQVQAAINAYNAQGLSAWGLQ